MATGSIQYPTGHFKVVRHDRNNVPQTSKRSRTLVDNKILDHSDVVGASHVDASFST